MPEPMYRIVRNLSFPNSLYEWSLLDPHGKVVSRSYARHPLEKTAAKLQEAFGLGRDWSYAESLARFNEQEMPHA